MSVSDADGLGSGDIGLWGSGPRAKYLRFRDCSFGGVVQGPKAYR